MYDYFFKIALVAGLLMKEGANSIVRHPLFFISAHLSIDVV